MSRGEVWTVDLEPAVGHESNKVRPAVIIGRDRLVRRAMELGGTVTVVPLTSRTDTVYAFQVLIPAGEAGLPVDSKAQAEQVRTVSVARLRTRVGRVAPATSAKVDRALRTYLGL